MNVFQREADVKVLFEFIGVRKNPTISGYRPDHLIKDDYLTCGVHEYFDVEKVMPDGKAYGTITFMSPNVYPACLWVGKRINIQEGNRIVGYATIIEIYNPLLSMSEIDGAKIIAISELGSYGYIKIAGSTGRKIEVCYLVICKYENADTIYLFLCDKDFNVENDCDFSSVDEAMQNAESRSKKLIKWTRRP